MYRAVCFACAFLYLYLHVRSLESQLLALEAHVADLEIQGLRMQQVVAVELVGSEPVDAEDAVDEYDAGGRRCDGVSVYDGSNDEADVGAALQCECELQCGSDCFLFLRRDEQRDVGEVACEGGDQYGDDPGLVGAEYASHEDVAPGGDEHHAVDLVQLRYRGREAHGVPEASAHEEKGVAGEDAEEKDGSEGEQNDIHLRMCVPYLYGLEAQLCSSSLFPFTCQRRRIFVQFTSHILI